MPPAADTCYAWYHALPWFAQGRRTGLEPRPTPTVPGREGTHELFPEYYLIKVERFDDCARDTLDEWVYFLKHEAIQDGFSAKGLREAKEKLRVMRVLICYTRS
jgi:hypothetical protein